MIEWGAPIWIYLWLAGMAGGAYFAGFLAERFGGGMGKSLLRVGTYLGVPLAVVGVMLLVVDLGNQQWFWHLFARFKVQSPMSMGSWILLLWVLIAVVMIVTWWLESRVKKGAASSLAGVRAFLSWIDAGLAAGLIAYTGVLLAVSNQSMWAGTALLPVLFVASAVSTGVAILILAAMALNSLKQGGLRRLADWIFGSTEWKVSADTIEQLAKADAIVILIELAALVGYVIWLAVAVGGSEALRMLVAGSMAAPFWIGVVLLALLVPFGLDMTIRGRAPEARGVLMTIMTSSLSAIVGGLILRWVITTGGQL